MVKDSIQVLWGLKAPPSSTTFQSYHKGSLGTLLLHPASPKLWVCASQSLPHLFLLSMTTLAATNSVEAEPGLSSLQRKEDYCINGAPDAEEFQEGKTRCSEKKEGVLLTA